MIACVFALSVFADDIYSDFTQNGANGEKPIFNFLGYAIDKETSSICCEYTVNVSALEAYEKAIGKRLDYGVVVAYADNIENGMPIDPETGMTTGANKDKIVVVPLKEKTERISIRITGIDTAQYSKQLAISVFVSENGDIKYVADKTTDKVETTASYKEIRGPLEVKINGVEYSTEGETDPGDQRVLEMTESKAVYNTIPMSNSDASSITSKANLIITGGTLYGWTNAAKLMQHFMDGTGEQYNLNMNEFLQDSVTKGYRDSDINNALRAAEALALVGETLDINQKEEYLHRAYSGDWYYAVNYYYSDVDILNLTVTIDENGVKTYNADIRYIMQDYYNWDKNDTKPAIEKKVWFVTITGPSPAELYRLHAAGRAQEFLTYGEITYTNVTWTERQTVAEIEGLN